MPLSEYSTDDLLAEVVRRRSAEQQAQPIEHWCHDCTQFKCNPRAGDTYNPCQKLHEMEFHLPDEWESPDEDGFYRRACPDFNQVPPPPPPAPPPPATHMEWIELKNANSPRAPRGSRPRLEAKGKAAAEPPAGPTESRP